MKILVTGSAGLIGSEAVIYFGGLGHEVFGLDNNLRKEFFGDGGDTSPNLARVKSLVPQYVHRHGDIRSRDLLNHAFQKDGPFDAVIHCAAQPSHDKSRDIPLIDFDVNAVGTVNLLEATRQFSPKAVFIFMSTNKVYGDAPNEKLLIELPTRFDYAKEEDKAGISESCRIDQSTHSVFGASKVAADIMVQEYGRYYGLKTTVFRGGCLTGPSHAGVELHGFLSYLVKACVHEIPYKIYGYKGKQVRDNIHSYDVVRAMEEVIKAPGYGDVYNLGGGRENSISVNEAIGIAEAVSQKRMMVGYAGENRIGDHICYISDLSKFKSHYPNWKITKSLTDIFGDLLGK